MNCASGELKVTRIDKDFYTHELREQYTSKNFTYKEAHKMALEDYGISYERGFEKGLYTEETMLSENNDFVL